MYAPTKELRYEAKKSSCNLPFILVILSFSNVVNLTITMEVCTNEIYSNNYCASPIHFSMTSSFGDVEEKVAEKVNGSDNHTLKYEFPFEIKFVDEEINKRLLNDFTGEKTGYVQVGPKKWFLPSKYMEDAKYYYNFEVRKDDTWVVTFPRSGTTWSQELVWLIQNDLNFDLAQKLNLTERFPFFEFNLFLHDETAAEFIAENAHSAENIAHIKEMTTPGYKALENVPSPRFIKTHLPFSLLPPNLLNEGCKVFYIARNPKDVAVSFYYLNKSIRTQGYKGDFAKYWDYFENNLHPWMPYWEHIQEGWINRHHPNMLFMFYEEMNKDLPMCIKRVCKFLNKDLSTEQIAMLCEYLSIKNFRQNSKVNFQEMKDLGIVLENEAGFVRKGETVNGWQDEYTPELKLRAEKWIEEHLNQTDLKFP